MAAQLAIQQGRGQSEPTSLCSFPSNSGSSPREAGHSQNAQIPNPVANHTKSPSPPVGEKTRNSLPIDVEGGCNKSQAPILATVDSSQCTNGNSIATGSGTPLCGSPGKNSITSECESEGHVKISTPAAEDIEQYTGRIDKLLAAADLDRVSTKKIWQKLEKELDRSLQDQMTAIRQLIKERFQVLKRLPLAGGFDIGKQGCPLPARSSRSDEHVKAKDTAGETNQPPKSPGPQPIVIDLTGNTEDHEPVHSLSPLQSTKPPGNNENAEIQHPT
ncbi:hypothetical protein V8F33_012232 [Rhypophila sp. PSN 637]